MATSIGPASRSSKSGGGEPATDDGSPRQARSQPAATARSRRISAHCILFDAAGINRRTAQAYERLLANLLVVEALPAWTSNRLKRLVLMPKRHLVDPALAGAVLGLDTNLVLREGDLLGRLLDTFVVAQLRAELAVSAARPRLYHVRQQQGRLEVDLLAELAGGRLVAIEIKADAAPSPDAGRHLATLRDLHPERFVAGIVLHTGPRTYRLGDRIVAAPISSLWG